MLVLATLATADSARAEVLRLEAVGAVPVLASSRQAPPKQAAIQAALREAVSRVAHDLLMDADPENSIETLDATELAELTESTELTELTESIELTESTELTEPPKLAELHPALGSNMLGYTTSFRILEDRGEQPALFVSDSGAATEYVVIVEVHVDAERVERRLVEAGLLASRGPRAAADTIRVEVLGLHQYGAYLEVRALLIDRLGVRSVAPLEFERGRALLAVETELQTANLLQGLLAAAPPNLEISPLGAEDGSLRLSVAWAPLPEETGVAAPDEAAVPLGLGR